MFAQSSPLSSCSSSRVVPGLNFLFVVPPAGVFLTFISSPASLTVSSILSSSPGSGWFLSSAVVNLFSTGRFLLSPGVPTDRGEGVVGSAVLYSVRDTYRGPAAFSLLPSYLNSNSSRPYGTRYFLVANIVSSFSAI